MSIAESDSPPLAPVVFEKPAPSLRSRIISCALFVGLLGVGVGIVEGMLLGLFLSSQGGGDSLLAVQFGLDRGLAFGLAGFVLGGLGGAVRGWLDKRHEQRR